MTKLKYKILFPKNIAQLEGILLQIFKSKQGHIIIKISNDYINPEDLKKVLEKHRDLIEKYQKNSSIVILYDGYEYVPEFIPVAPTEKEAVDIIEFEEIERNLFENE